MLFYCTHSICHKQSLSSCYHLFPPIFDKRFLDGDYMCHLWLLKHFICFKRYRRFTAHQFGQKWSLPQQLLYNVSSSGPPSSPLLSIFCLGRRTLSTSFKSLLRYRQILQWSPWSSRAPNTQFGLIQTVTY